MEKCKVKNNSKKVYKKIKFWKTFGYKKKCLKVTLKNLKIRKL